MLDIKMRSDIRRIDNRIEHWWIEVQGKNKNHSYLLCVFYQPNQVVPFFIIINSVINRKYKNILKTYYKRDT